MKIFISLLSAAMITACAGNSSNTLIPPPSSNPDMAQITIKREFRLLGGGNSHYVYDLFDLGDGVDYNAELRRADQRPTSPLVPIGKVTMDIFSVLTPSAVSIIVEDGNVVESEHIDPIQHHEKLVEKIDESLIGITLLARTDPSGGSRVRATDRISLGREGLKQIKLRQLYDIDARILYRVLEIATDPCIQSISNISTDIDPPDELVAANGLANQNFTQYSQDSSAIRDALVEIAPDFQYRPEDYLYAEFCGFHVDRDVLLNSRYVGAIRGFDQETWYRPPGRMALLGKQGWVTVLANEIEVQAGEQYVGTFDPYSQSFVVKMID